MDLLLSLITLVATISFLTLLHLLTTIIWSHKPKGNIVPEARGSWPIIGHLPLLAGSQAPHKLLASLADKFGPIFTIKLGVHQVLVVSNSDMAKECLATNDRSFAGRPKSMASELIGYNYANFALASHGPYWRHIQKIVVHELVSHRRLQMLAHIRVSEVKSSTTDLYKSWIGKKGSEEMLKVDMKKWFENLALNMILRMVFGDRFSTGEKDRDQFKKSVKLFSELLSAFVPSDAIPGLRWLDLGGYEKKMKKIAKELDVILEGWLEEHKMKMDYSIQQADHESKDQVFMATLLSRVKEELNEDLYGFSAETIVKATCLAILAASIDTIPTTLTWILALLINNPHVLKKAQNELEICFGRDGEIRESNLKNLVYLEAIIKESMRLYPAAPLLVPHESIEDCIIGGYTVPKGTRLLVNVWKIHHDPEIWSDPFEFQPERFLSSKREIDVRGQHFELIPFGSGRRMCIGSSLALEAMQLILASIIHGFEFRNPSNEQKIDMTEICGLVNRKAIPLELLVIPRHLPGLN
ncbi:hypothetical protein OSB04_003116 [Centaurea solstitialis]|uniref:Cytochrome P450 n=1 Tax=Centaurea solstitialis TaxID=347529 RepID=A0AA38TU86_9ASTR|nr:hypothetical protein OSB04_003116 [Centaurea solstitialis]